MNGITRDAAPEIAANVLHADAIERALADVANRVLAMQDNHRAFNERASSHRQTMVRTDQNSGVYLKRAAQIPAVVAGRLCELLGVTDVNAIADTVARRGKHSFVDVVQRDQQATLAGINLSVAQFEAPPRESPPAPKRSPYPPEPPEAA